MPKYRLLTFEELEELEKEFIDYLVVNGITKDDWEDLKSKNSTKAQEIIELFSDVVFEGIMRKAEYLVKFDTKTIYAFKCNSENIELASIETQEPSIDFSTSECQQILVSAPPSDLTGFKASKKYNDVRELEIFQMTQNGCTITDNEWYDALAKII
jgi:5'-3' exonuclease